MDHTCAAIDGGPAGAPASLPTQSTNCRAPASRGTPEYACRYAAQNDGPHCSIGEGYPTVVTPTPSQPGSTARLTVSLEVSFEVRIEVEGPGPGRGPHWDQYGQ